MDAPEILWQLVTLGHHILTDILSLILLCVSGCFGSFSGKNRRHISVEILLQVHLPCHAAFLELTSLLGQAVWKRCVYIDSSIWVVHVRVVFHSISECFLQTKTSRPLWTKQQSWSKSRSPSVNAEPLERCNAAGPALLHRRSAREGQKARDVLKILRQKYSYMVLHSSGPLVNTERRKRMTHDSHDACNLAFLCRRE